MFVQWRISNVARDMGACYLIRAKTAPTLVVGAERKSQAVLLSQFLPIASLGADDEFSHVGAMMRWVRIGVVSCNLSA